MDRWVAKDLKYNWHPYTQMKDCLRFPPILIERAKGMKLFDKSGKFYYDTIASWWCNVHGHNHPAIKRSIRKQLDELEHVLFAGFTHRSAIRLAERLVSIAPRGLEKVFFSDDGSTAVETALKMSVQYWHNTGSAGKASFIALDHGYHGDTIGTMSVSGVSLFTRPFEPLLFASTKVPAPYCYRCPMRLAPENCGIACIRPLEAALRARSRKVAALILEPMVLAAGGMIVYPAEYLRRAAGLARKYNVHFIADEVATGFGRTGRMFACDHAGVAPDFLCLSKGITAGYLPLGATLTSKKIHGAFYGDYAEGKTFYHGHTYTANPVACAAALASLDLFRAEDTLGRVQGLASELKARMERFRQLPIVGDVRSIGMIGAVELVRDRNTKERFGAKERIGMDIYKRGLKRNLVLRPLGNIAYLFLPLSVTGGELEYILDTMYAVLKDTPSR